MTSVVKEAMNKWGRKFLINRGFEVAEDASIDFEDELEYSGYCETCWYEEYVVYVSDDAGNRAKYWGDMGALIREMTEEE